MLFYSYHNIIIYLKNIDWNSISHKIDDLIIKTIISIESNLRQNCKNYIGYRNSCYEIFGFDILIDSFLNPWLLEVNLSPSLNCDSPLDQKIKGELIAESLNIASNNDNYIKYLLKIHSLY